MPEYDHTLLMLQAVDDPGLERFLADIYESPCLSGEKVFELAERYHGDGHQESGARLVKSHMRLVVRVVWKYREYWQGNILDLIQEGNVGLVLALSKYDPYRNVSFATYAYYWIQACIKKFIMKNWRMVNICTARRKRLMFFRCQTREETSSAMAMAAGEAEDMWQRIHGEDVHLEEFGGGLTDADFLWLNDITADPVEESGMRAEAEEQVRGVLNCLQKAMNPREQQIFRKRLFSDEPTSLEKIAAGFELSRERIRQIEAGLLEKLREALPRDFVDVF